MDELREFNYLVTVIAPDERKADQVMNERICHDEDYDFEYTISWDQFRELGVNQ